MKERDEGPKSELARYAFGYSDKKPSLTYWIIQGALILFCLYNIFTIGWR